jgi:hypothetical protein
MYQYTRGHNNFAQGAEYSGAGPAKKDKAQKSVNFVLGLFNETFNC